MTPPNPLPPVWTQHKVALIALGTARANVKSWLRACMTGFLGYAPGSTSNIFEILEARRCVYWVHFRLIYVINFIDLVDSNRQWVG
jgi:hypothetical protein